MSLAEIAREHSAVRRRLAAVAGDEAARLWGQVAPGRIAASWLAVLPRLLVVLTGAQQAAASRADGYLEEALAEQGVRSRAVGRVSASALAGVASDGRGLGELLYQPVVRSLVAIKARADVDRGLAVGRVSLDMIVRTQVADAGRAADQVAMTARPAVGGYVRLLVGGSCSRCVILAGEFYEWNQGFQRHPACDCLHVPAQEDAPDDVRTDPAAYFRSLDEAEQDRVFTAAGAQAIRDGADIFRVVNARRGMSTAADSLGRRRLVRDEAGLLTTTEGTTRRGRRAGQTRGPRLMPESIYEIAAGNRDEALRLLAFHGYLTDERQARPARPAAARPAPEPVVTHAERWAAGATGQDALDAVPAGLARRAERGDVVLSRAQRDALREYESSYYYAINGQLRSGEVNGRVQRIVDRIDAGMAASRARRELSVWRGITNAQRLFGDRINGDLTGMEWREVSYVSTTAEERVARSFTYPGAGGENPVVMRLVVPSGVGAMHISGTLGIGQAEVLLERGLRLRVVRDRGVSPAGYRLLDVEVLP